MASRWWRCAWVPTGNSSEMGSLLSRSPSPVHAGAAAAAPPPRTDGPTSADKTAGATASLPVLLLARTMPTLVSARRRRELVPESASPPPMATDRGAAVTAPAAVPVDAPSECEEPVAHTDTRRDVLRSRLLPDSIDGVGGGGVAPTSANRGLRPLVPSADDSEGAEPLNPVAAAAATTAAVRLRRGSGGTEAVVSAGERKSRSGNADTLPSDTCS